MTGAVFGPKEKAMIARPAILGWAALACVLAMPVASVAQTRIAIGMQQEPTTLDPTTDATAAINAMLAQNVYESLTSVDESGTVIPQLATSWTVSPDGLTYTFTLARGVKFHDGTDFDAEDVLFSFNRARAEGSTNPRRQTFAPITDISAPDPYTVTITLKEPSAFFLFDLAQGTASIVNPEAVEANATTPIGTGAYRFDSWTRGDRLRLVKNPDHRDAAAVQVDVVEFRFIADPAAATAAMLTGEIDAFPGFPAPELLEQFEADPRFNVVVGSTEGEVILAMNNGKAPFNDIRVRRAVSHAIDRAAIIDGAMYGKAVPIGSFYPPHGPAYVDLTGLYPHDTARARALFEEAGVLGQTFTLRVPPFPYATRSAEIIQAQLGAAGVDVKVEGVEWGFWLEEVFRNRNYDMTIIAHTSPNDMGNFARGPSYFYGYDDPEFVALWNRISTTVDDEARYELLRQGQRHIAERAVHGFLFQLPALGVYRKGVSGFWSSSPVLYQPLKLIRVE
jgi:peptide/nickel transport system substrate-binding protein